jgi:hypothetical protein
MFKTRSATQLAAAVVASGCFALALGAHAEAPCKSATKPDANAANEAAPAKQVTGAAKAPREDRRWDMEGVLGGQ